MKQMEMLYETPTMEVIVFECMDVVTLSNQGTESGTTTVDKVEWEEGLW